MDDVDDDNNNYEAYDDADDADREVALPSSSSSQVEINLAEQGIDSIPQEYFTMDSASYTPDSVTNISLSNNQLIQIPSTINVFTNLYSIDMYNNALTSLPEELGELRKLRFLDVRNNLLEDLPKSLGNLKNLLALNASGNRLTHIPNALFQLKTLKALYLGGNRIEHIPNAIGSLISLNVLYLGGNCLREVPATIGRLMNLNVLSLCANQLESIPTTIADLQALRTLALHSNLLTTLPTEIVRLRNLQHLSLRSNPLVNKFVSDMSFDPPTLKELSARMVRMWISKTIWKSVLPHELIHYISSANQCVNPKCKGVYFDACIEHVKFVDFCGKYRVPLLQYLCSPRCSSTNPAYRINSESSSDSEGIADDAPSSTATIAANYKLRKVMLG